MDRRIGQLTWALGTIALLAAMSSPPGVGAEPDEASEPEADLATRSRAAAGKALPLLARGSAGSAKHRKCFTCHSQAMPVLAIVAGQQRGIKADKENLKLQVEHTYAHLQRGRENYLKGKGQGGGIDTAGYALWTLEDGRRDADDVTSAVTNYLLKQQQRGGHWRTSSKRPPSEASNLTATYLALRALGAFGTDQRQEEIRESTQRAAKWLADAEPKDTEDHVFHLLALNYVEPASDQVEAAAKALRSLQREDGGWSQKTDMQSDAYATGTALYALSETGTAPDDKLYQRGAQFLLDSQLEDGSWHIVSRSKPFQTYFETGFPHEKDQFISTTATAWATIALLRTAPAQGKTEASGGAFLRPREITSDLEAGQIRQLMLNAALQLCDVNSRLAVQGCVKTREARLALPFAWLGLSLRDDKPEAIPGRIYRMY